MKIDLHIHTTASDGCWDPHEVVDEAIKADLGLIAVTDHESIGSVKETERLAKEKNIHFIRGIEFSCLYEKQICHILGYGIDPDSKLIDQLCKENRNRFEKLNIDQAKQLISKGFAIDLEEFASYKQDRKRGGGKITNFLVDKGYFKSFKEALEYSARELSWNTPDFPHPKEAVEVIVGAGGVPILAHPGSTLLSTGLSEKELDRLVSFGIRGLECFTSYHNGEMSEIFVKFCKERDLLITAGSDCHGPLLSARVLGKPEVHLDQVNLGEIFQI